MGLRPRARVVHSLAAGVDFERYFRWRRRRDGDPFLLWFPAVGDVLFTGSPEGARELLRAPRALLEPPRPNPIAPVVGEASLILTAGERHRRDRALVMPPLHVARMPGYADRIQAAARAEIAHWRPGLRVDSRAATRSVTLRVILDVVFGVRGGSERESEFLPAVADFMQSYPELLMLAPAARRGFFGLAPWDRFRAARSRTDALIARQIDCRRAELAPDAEPDDLLGMLLCARYDDGAPIDEKDLREQLRTLLVAGHETTALSMAWALYRLYRDRGLLARVRAEIAGLGPDPAAPELARLPLLGAVCDETLRLHPPVPLVLRRVVDAAPADAVSLRGVAVRPGATMAIAVPLLHRDPAVWTDPDRFDPDRFLGRKYAPYEYAPFGGAHRRCVGYALAEYEMRIVVGTVVSSVDLALRPRDRRRPPRSVPRGIAAGPRRPLRFDVVSVL